MMSGDRKEKKQNRKKQKNIRKFLDKESSER